MGEGIGGVAFSAPVAGLSKARALRHLMVQKIHAQQLKHKHDTTPPTIPAIIAVKATTALARGPKSMDSVGAAAGLVLLIWGVGTVTGEPVTKATAVLRALLYSGDWRSDMIFAGA